MLIFDYENGDFTKAHKKLQWGCADYYCQSSVLHKAHHFLLPGQEALWHILSNKSTIFILL